MEAPLSSPSLHGPSQTQPSYLTPSSTSSSSSSSASTQPSSYSSASGQPATQQYAPQTQHSTYHPQAQTQYQVPPPAPAQQRQPADGTSPFLRDFNLVAEAAKRAQMAVLMRDMEAVGI